jgi:hypothetical protein
MDAMVAKKRGKAMVAWEEGRREEGKVRWGGGK